MATKRVCWALAALTLALGCEGTLVQPRGAEARQGHMGAALNAGPAVASARKVAPGLYAVRASVQSGTVTLVVRAAVGGFPSLTSGAEMIRFHQDGGMAEAQIQTVPGYRYLVVALPGESDPALLDYSLAHYTELTP